MIDANVQVKLNNSHFGSGFDPRSPGWGNCVLPHIKNWLHDEIGNDNWFYDGSLNRIFLRNEEDKVKFILQWM